MLKILFCHVLITLLFCSGGLIAQVSNNNISARSLLTLDQSPTISTTNNSTVEWQCVNKKLTNKCLVYHNDQWFTFTPSVTGKYFINLSASNCRDNRGIQAIVIQGNPCEVSTYKIRKCVPQIRFLDSFIEVDSMEANTPYLINIDGFLGDYCEFSIQISSRPHGVSVEGRAMNRLDLPGTTDEGIRKISWKLPVNLQDSIVSFSVYSKPDHQQVSALRSLVPIEINAKGEYQSEYSYIDSLQGKRPYSYQVVGNMKDNRQIILDEWFAIGSAASRGSEFKISVNLDYPDRSKLQILLVDSRRETVLRQRTFTFNEVLDKTQSFYVENDVKKGTGAFTVVVVDLKTRRKREMLFWVNNQGEVTRP